MGYNGGINKRGYYRRKHGMFRKSSYRSGEKILSGFILGGLGLIAAASSTSTIKSSLSRTRKSTTMQSAYTPPPKPLSVKDSILNRLTSGNFRKLKDDYDDVVCYNDRINNRIRRLQKKAMLNNILVILFYFIPKCRSAFENKIQELSDSIIQEQKKIVVPSINTYALSDNNLSKNPLINRGKILMTFYDVPNESYLNEHKTIKVLEQLKNYFNYNGRAIVIFNSELIQLHLFINGIIVMGKNTFGVVDYNDIISHFTTLYIKTPYAESSLKVVRKTWLHAKINGDKDLRYNDNYEIYLVEYGCLKLIFNDNLTVNILFSDTSYGKEVARLFNLIPIEKTIVVPATLKGYTDVYNKETADIPIASKVYTTTYNKATLTQIEKEFCDVIRRYGKPLNIRIAYKRPQIGSSVKRRSDGAILEVVNISADHKFKCYDFAKDDCFIYTKDELMLS